MKKLVLHDCFWKDENGNCWDANVWSYELACKLSESLIECMDCYNCIGCYYCNNCNNCVNCNLCDYCSDCYMSVHCTACRCLDQCYYCDYCRFMVCTMYAKNSKNIVDLEYAFDMKNKAHHKGLDSDSVNIYDDFVQCYFYGQYEKYKNSYMGEDGKVLVKRPGFLREIHEQDGYYVDQFNNKWDCSKYTYKQALYLSESLEDCCDCINSFNLVRCKGCKDCFDLIEAEYLSETIHYYDLGKREEKKMREVKLVGDYWVDERDNRWLAKDYPYELVIHMADTLIDCYACVDCEYCTNCTNLIDCSHCIDCHYLKHTSNRNGCEHMAEYLIHSDDGASIFVSCVLGEGDLFDKKEVGSVDALMCELKKLSYSSLVKDVKDMLGGESHV